MAPKVSIGMPVFNGQDYLEDAIESVLRQTYADFELVISDNCSTDRTAEICQAYMERDSRVRYVKQEENLGAVGNFNAVVHLGEGEYFKWAAHDDLMEPTFIEKCVEVLDNDPTLAWCHTESDMIDAEGRSFRELLPENDEELELTPDGNVRWNWHPRTGYQSSDPVERFKGVILGPNWCVDAYALFRMSHLKKSRLYLSFYGAEKVLLGELSLLGGYHVIPELLFYQRIHTKASSNLNSSESEQEFAGTKRKFNFFLSARMAIFKAHFGSVWRANLSLRKKLAGTAVVLSYWFQFKKWGRMYSKIIHRQGIGGGGHRILESSRS